mgnify:CR=1 FL=1
MDVAADPVERSAEASGTVVIPFPAEAAVELEVRMILPAERMQDQGVVRRFLWM